MSGRRLSLPWQLMSVGTALGVLLLAGAILLGLWAKDRIDSEVRDRQAQFIASGLADIAARTQTEQDSVVRWDDTVVHLRAHDTPWVEDNITVWMSQFFGHDRVYVLDSTDHPVYAARDGITATPETSSADLAAIAPLVAALRTKMRDASSGQTDSTASITGLGEMDRVSLGDGTVGIVSVRPIVPTTATVLQPPGSEYLHVSIRLFDADLSDMIGGKFAIDQLQFRGPAEPTGDLEVTPVLNDAGRVLGFFAWRASAPAAQLVHDVTPALAATLAAIMLFVALLILRLRSASRQLAHSEAEARFLAFHDPLTRLPNRALFEDRLDQALAANRQSGARFALLSIDLDHFKRVNDTLGHPAGDELIREVAARLRSLLAGIDTVARVGGDEFAVIQCNIADPSDAQVLATRIIAALERPFNLGGQEALISASIGIIVVEGDTVREDVLKQADMALYGAKSGGRGRYQVFAGALDVAVRDRRTIELELRASLTGGTGLELMFQPIVEAQSGNIAGAKALVRWTSPSRGPLQPADVIGIAEERGLVDQLGLFVLRAACRFAADQALPWVAVNASPLQFNDHRFADRVLAVLTELRYDPQRLELNITEGLLLQNSPAVQNSIRHLRAAGIRVALDDLGTGYSSISYLRAHGVDKLKIDPSFVARLGHDPENDDIVRSIISLGRALRMKVMAEGVETPAQREALTIMGCDQLQGDLIAPPLSGEALAELLENRVRSPRHGAAA